MSRAEEQKCFNLIRDALNAKENIDVVYDNSNGAVRDFFNIAKSNPSENDYPDFVFENGGIEHFQLTSSKENKKGSNFKREETRKEKDKKEYLEELNKKYLKTEFVSGTFTSEVYEDVYESFSYEDFLKSLEKNIPSHVNSLNKSNYKKAINIFLMEQQTARLWIDEGVVPIKFYQLHKDKRALNIIKSFCSNVRYVVYFVCDAIEIIDLSKIDLLIEHSREYNNVKGGRLIKSQINLFIDW